MLDFRSSGETPTLGWGLIQLTLGSKEAVGMGPNTIVGIPLAVRLFAAGASPAAHGCESKNRSAKSTAFGLF